jgi:hypothetical protein
LFVVQVLRRLSQCLMRVVAGTKTEEEAEEKQRVERMLTAA